MTDFPLIRGSDGDQDHKFAAINLLLHDVNSLEAEKEVALAGVRKSGALMRLLPPPVRHLNEIKRQILIGLRSLSPKSRRSVSSYGV